MKEFSVRNRVLYGIWATLLLAVAPPVIYLAVALREDFSREARNIALKDLEVTAWLLREHAPFRDAGELAAWMEEYGKYSRQRLSYLVDGRVTADSEVRPQDLGRLDDHDSRPEILDTQAGGVGVYQRLSLSLRKEMVYAARAINDVPGMPPGVLRLSLPLSEIHERLSRTWMTMAWVLGACFAMAGLISYLAMFPLVRGMRRMAVDAEAIGLGTEGRTRRIRYAPWKELQPLAGAINRMADNIQEQFAELEEKNEKLQAVFNAMHEGVLILDETGRLVDANEAARRLLSSPLDEGRTLLEAAMLLDLQRAADALRAGTTRESSVIFPTPGGGTCEASLAHLRQGKGEMLVVVRDISNQQRLDLVRREFVANVSHELKTPLTSIRGYAEALRDMPLSSGQRESFLEAIARNADHMTRMVSGLLTLARAEYQGEHGMTPQPVDVGSVLREALTILAPMAETAQLDMAWPEADTTPELVAAAEREAVSEVVRNLLDNAVKYTPAGGRVRLSATAADGNIVVRVEDDGPAIPEENRERIFERFYRAKDSGAAKNGSAGLGLAICKRIVKSLGGHIWLETPLDPLNSTGVAFCFSLPRA